MHYEPTPFEGLFIASGDPIADSRGRFCRLFCDITHENVTGQKFTPLQINQSVTIQAGTVRGMHFQRFPALESKIVRCTRGRVMDVAIDLRQKSKTFLQHFCTELSADNMSALVIPEGFAHGFQSLEDDCEMLYLHSSAYARTYEGGLRHDDPALGIKWPLEIMAMSDRDRSFDYITKDFKGIDYEM